MAHWHDFNPWAATLLYLPDLDEAKELTYPGSVVLAQTNTKKVDAYLLRQPDGYFELGFRFGARADEYFSPYCKQEKAKLLWEKYRD